MARDASSEAKANSTTDNALQSTYGDTASTAVGSVLPYYEQQLVNPTGYTPAQKASMLTASSQSLGGGQSAAVGAGNLMAARTRNAGGFGAALDASSRDAGRTLSQNALGVQNSDATLEQQKQAAAASGLSSLYSTAAGDTLGAANASTAAINAQTSADQATTQAWQGPVDAAIGGISSAAGGAGIRKLGVSSRSSSGGY